jgi:hypothetical protein
MTYAPDLPKSLKAQFREKARREKSSFAPIIPRLPGTSNPVTTLTCLDEGIRERLLTPEDVTLTDAGSYSAANWGPLAAAYSPPCRAQIRSRRMRSCMLAISGVKAKMQLVTHQLQHLT